MENGRLAAVRLAVGGLLVLGAAIGPARGEVVGIKVDLGKVGGEVSRYLTGVCLEDVNHEVYGGLYSQMIFGESFQEPGRDEVGNEGGMWRSYRREGAIGRAEVSGERPFVGGQSERIVFASGSGEVGVENRGLNRRGLGVVEKKGYVGHVWARAAADTKVKVALASGDGGRVYARAEVAVRGGGEWAKYDFVLTPDATDSAARFEVGLTSAGEVGLGYVFLERGEWGRFKGLPVRRDVAEALVGQGVSLIRYGGSMVNTDEYRWKKMIGERDRRPPYTGVWYKYSTNGWGIVDFLNFAEAVGEGGGGGGGDGGGVLAIPDFNINESPQDMVDFVEYVNGGAETTWGAKRVADGHAKPYGVTHIELGNEERVDGVYAKKFEALARAIWSKEPGMVLTVGDFAYLRPITDPMRVEGADSKITDLSGHRRILEIAKELGGEVWFDVHLWTHDLKGNGTVEALPSYVDAIDKLAAEVGGAKHRVVVFELNGFSHGVERALANARAMMGIERDGRVPVVVAANCLQVAGANDNGWDQGLVFMDSMGVWVQPPGLGVGMWGRGWLPGARVVGSEVGAGGKDLSVVAEVSGGGKVVVVRVVNVGEEVRVKLGVGGRGGWEMRGREVNVERMGGAMGDVNGPGAGGERVRVEARKERGAGEGGDEFVVGARSMVVFRVEGK